ncbi:hypothetical protein [Bacteriovorax sp. Seq25_V]|uniref:hypothetical protein n=1 Tax=Bacteriovorax sp. Seq25_V TaxID=1201288 RepID=UPI000389E41F|nr:hypothetical protein [Bacteriovorax sp. Seq25_V]EQC43683.1 hypothetical protein M900_1439 [Bacteriovorax sp. Seq25_V]
MKYLLVLLIAISAKALVKPDVVITAIYCETFGYAPVMGYERGNNTPPGLTNLYKSHVNLFRANGIKLSQILTDVQIYARTAGGGNGTKGTDQKCSKVSSDKTILENYNLLKRAYCENLKVDRDDSDPNFIHRLWKLYSGQATIEEFKNEFNGLASSSGQNEKKCSGYSDVTVSQSVKEDKTDLNNFEFLSLEEVYSPNNIYLPNYKGKPYCEQQGQAQFERFELFANFNETFYKKLVGCTDKALQGNDKNCFEVELRVKSMKRECLKNKGDQTECLSNADLWGNLELDKNNCGRKIDWAGIHHSRNLTNPSLKILCSLDSYTPSVLADDGLISIGSREEPYAKQMVSYNQCINQACYDTQREFFPKKISLEQKINKECKETYPYERECTSNPIALHGNPPTYMCDGQKDYNIQCVYTFPIAMENGKAPDFLKERISKEADWAKKFHGRYINNQTFAQVGPNGENLNTTAWYVFSLDSQAKYVRGGYRVYVNCDSNKFVPEVDGEGNPVFKDKSKGQISWIDSSKQTTMKTTLRNNQGKKIAGSESGGKDSDHLSPGTESFSKSASSSGSGLKSVVQGAKMLREISGGSNTLCSSAVASQIAGDLRNEISNLTSDLRKQAIEANCWENKKISMNSPDCDHFKAKDIVLNLSKRRQEIYKEYQDKYRAQASDNKACSGEYENFEDAVNNSEV